jgi:proteasome accessory factor A
MQRRPLVNTRDEPHADPRKYRRFHVIIGDANLSPFATYLKVGSTALVLQALANGAPRERIPRLADPLAALPAISRDLSWKWPVRTAGGRTLGAVDVQRAYLELVREFAPPADAAWARLVTDWDEVLRDLERDPLSTADRLDWAAKYRLIEQFREGEGIAADDPWLRSLDLSYHLLDPAAGLFYALRDSGAFRLPFPAASIYGLALRPPLTTRAALRGGCIEKFGGDVESAQWDGVVLRDGRLRIELDLGDVFTPDLVAAGRAALAAARRPGELLSLPFAKTL